MRNRLSLFKQIWGLYAAKLKKQMHKKKASIVDAFYKKFIPLV